MIEKNSAGDTVFTVFNYLIMTAFSFLCLYPLIHVFMGSISDPIKLLQHTGVLLWPDGFSLKGYQIVLENPNIRIGYFNTILYVVAGTAINLFLSTLGAYGLSRKNLMLKRPMLFFIVFTMYFSGGIIPNFLLVRGLHMYNTYWALLLPGAIATWNMIIMKTSIQAIPDSLEESAKIDGANDFLILFRIILPVAKATIAVMILFYAVGHWNSWFNAMIYLRDRDKFPLQLFLREILIGNSAAGAGLDSDMIFMEEVLKYCTVIVATVPILFIYPFVQRHFMTGIMMGSLKE